MQIRSFRGRNKVRPYTRESRQLTEAVGGTIWVHRCPKKTEKEKTDELMESTALLDHRHDPGSHPECVRQ
jgi:hypothetical protein